MTKASKLLENLITILDRDILRQICDVSNGAKGEENYLCKGIYCAECPFSGLYNPEAIQPLKDSLKTIKTLELIDVDSREQDI